MAQTMLEQMRALHEEIEALEHGVVATLESKGKSVRTKGEVFFTIVCFP